MAKSGLEIKIFRGSKEITYRELSLSELQTLHSWSKKLGSTITKLIFERYDPQRDFNPEPELGYPPIPFPEKKLPPTD